MRKLNLITVILPSLVSISSFAQTYLPTAGGTYRTILSRGEPNSNGLGFTNTIATSPHSWLMGAGAYNLTYQGWSIFDETSGKLPLIIYDNSDVILSGTGGNVGVGTTSPSSRFEVRGGSGLAISADVTDQNYALLRLQNRSVATDFSKAFSIYQADNGRSTIYNNSVETISLGTDGNIGIGASSPASKLEIRGGSKIAILADVTDQNYYLLRLQNRAVSTDFTKAFSIVQANKGRATIYNNSLETISFGADGNVGIGTVTPGQKLSVNGYVMAKKIIVTQIGWSDYVFGKKYKLRSLSSLEAFIQQNKHLPDVPSAKEVEEKGISVGDNQALLLKKIEELTLYIISIKKTEVDLVKRIKKLESKLDK